MISPKKRLESIFESLRGKKLSRRERSKQAVEIAKELLELAHSLQQPNERKRAKRFAMISRDPQSKYFLLKATDLLYRSQSDKATVNVLRSLLRTVGFPTFASTYEKTFLLFFYLFGNVCPTFFLSHARRLLQREISPFILPGEPELLTPLLEKKEAQGWRTHLNRIGEASLGEEQAQKQLSIYLEDLKNPDLERISIKISSLYSQINLVAFEKTLSHLINSLSLLYDAAMHHSYIDREGRPRHKSVHLDMERFQDLDLTVELFKRTLSLPQFLRYEGGIALQAYLPQSFPIFKELIAFAIERKKKGGAPLYIRIVKGANLAIERVEASLNSWCQAPFPSKLLTDANFKKMVDYGFANQEERAFRIGIGSHNLFEIAYVLAYLQESEEQDFCELEMLEGMVPHFAAALKEMGRTPLLYSPAIAANHFDEAIPYLVRRFDESSYKEHFLSHSFDLAPETREWRELEKAFLNSVESLEKDSSPSKLFSRRRQPSSEISLRAHSPFVNESPRDWCEEENRQRVTAALTSLRNSLPARIHSFIDGKEVWDETRTVKRSSPAEENIDLFQYAPTSASSIDLALQTAEKEQLLWGSSPYGGRIQLAQTLASLLRQERFNLIAALILSSAKTVQEADLEVTEAIDFVEFYGENLHYWHRFEDISWSPKGVTLVAPPWNFALSIAVGSIIAALLAGNCVLFKPTKEGIFVGWKLAELIWKAGFSKKVLQFIVCSNNPEGSLLIKDERVHLVMLTGSSATARRFLSMRADIDLIGETGGKNSLIVTKFADRHQAIHDIIHSAFAYSGQKCSALSLLILEEELYNDEEFMSNLRDGASSLIVAAATKEEAFITPLVTSPSEEFTRAATTLEEGESWLLEPKILDSLPNLYSPAIKIGVQRGSYSHRTELFGPLLTVIKATDLEEAISIANETPYALTAGLHSLNQEEWEIWHRDIEAGNRYINRPITGAVVQRQPFGGYKDSSFGAAFKAGGVNYLLQCCHAESSSLPKEQKPIDESLLALNQFAMRALEDKEERKSWQKSVGNYCYWFENHFKGRVDAQKIIGEDNFTSYIPLSVHLRISPSDPLIDLLRAVVACKISSSELIVSLPFSYLFLAQNQREELEKMGIRIRQESDETFVRLLLDAKRQRVRLLSPPNPRLSLLLASKAARIVQKKVVANGRIELLNYMREISLSIRYHRYGNLGARELEPRSPLRQPTFITP